MNTISKTLLQRLKSGAKDDDLDALIDALCAFEEPLDKLSIDWIIKNINENHEIAFPDLSQGEKSKDFRLNRISFCNFRTFPQNDPPYSVCFNNIDGKPCSLFLVGRNGTGKSTIFDALEWIYAGKVSNAEERGVFDQNEVKKYLTYGFGDIKNITSELVKLKVELNDRQWMSSEWKSVNSITPLCVPAICCSDRDIERIAQLDDSLTNDGVEGDYRAFVREQLGYGDLSLLKERLSAFKTEMAERSETLKHRRKLAELSSADILSIIDLFEWMLIDYRENPAERNADLILKYANIEEVKNTLHSDNFEKLLDDFPEKFKSFWTELKENVAQKAQIENPEVGEGFNIPKTTEDDPKQPNIDEQIESIIAWLAAMTGRLNKAWETYKNNDDGQGFAASMKNLIADFDFLKNENNVLPKGDSKLSKMIENETRLGNALTQLETHLEKVFARLLLAKEPTTEGEQKYQNNYTNKLKRFLEKVLNHYKESNEKFEVDNNANRFEVTITVTTDEGEEFSTSPKRYLNTFRFKMYAVLLKIALSLYYMKENLCVAPIVIDDVFNASDFENSINLSVFVSSIFDVYQEVIGFEYPLQLIMLTHDEMVTSAFKNGAKLRPPILQERINRGEIQANENYCLTGRLFPYSEAHSIQALCDKNGDGLNLYMTTNI